MNYNNYNITHFILATYSLEIRKFNITHYIDTLLNLVQTMPEWVMNLFQIAIDIVGSSGIAVI